MDPLALPIGQAKGVVSTLKLRRDGATTWLLFDQATGMDVGGVRHVHAASGEHYVPWISVDGAGRDMHSAFPQLAQAARHISGSYQRPDRQ